MVNCVLAEIPICEKQDYVWDAELKECVCAFKCPYTDPVKGPMTWNLLTCSYDCVPQTCLDDTYYWDAEKC